MVVQVRETMVKLATCAERAYRQLCSMLINNNNIINKNNNRQRQPKSKIFILVYANWLHLVYKYFEDYIIFSCQIQRTFL